MTSKYTPLNEYLLSLDPGKCDVTLSFDQIERIINDKLPYSAHTHQAWWGNEVGGQHVHARAWMDAGWKVDAINQQAKWVRFLRVSPVR
jgi:hypothetical protein